MQKQFYAWRLTLKNLNTTQKRFGTLFLLVLVLGSAAIAVFGVHAGGETIVDPEPLDHIIYPPAEMTQNNPALTSLAAMYAPMDTQENWIGSVCVGMTKGGCAYFKAHQAAAIWGRQHGNIGSSAGYISNTTVVDENHEVWTAETSIFTQGPNDKHSLENNFDVHVLVERGADQKWYLDRVLIGPGIDLEPAD
jgi:hypothetical protein